jgi:hypothetical protein
MITLKKTDAYFPKTQINGTDDWELDEGIYNFYTEDCESEVQQWYLTFEDGGGETIVQGTLEPDAFDTQDTRIHQVEINPIRLHRLLTPWHLTGTYYRDYGYTDYFLAELESAVGDIVYLQMQTYEQEEVYLTLVSEEDGDFDIRDWYKVSEKELYKCLDTNLFLEYMQEVQNFVLEYMA